jgi:hypothetical protein
MNAGCPARIGGGAGAVGVGGDTRGRGRMVGGARHRWGGVRAPFLWEGEEPWVVWCAALAGPAAPSFLGHHPAPSSCAIPLEDARGPHHPPVPSSCAMPLDGGTQRTWQSFQLHILGEPAFLAVHSAWQCAPMCLGAWLPPRGAVWPPPVSPAPPPPTQAHPSGPTATWPAGRPAQSPISISDLALFAITPPIVIWTMTLRAPLGC